MRPFLLASLTCASLALPKGTRLWSSFPAGKDSLTPDLKPLDSARTVLFLQCRGAWMQVMTPGGKAVWARVPKPAPVPKPSKRPSSKASSVADTPMAEGMTPSGAEA